MTSPPLFALYKRWVAYFWGKDEFSRLLHSKKNRWVCSPGFSNLTAEYSKTVSFLECFANLGQKIFDLENDSIGF